MLLLPPPPPPAHRCLLVLRLSAAHLLLSNGSSTCILLTKWRKTECASVASFIWMLPKVCNTWSRKTLINSPPHEKDTSASGMISHRIRDSDLPTGAWANIVELTKLKSIRNSMLFSFYEDPFLRLKLANHANYLRLFRFSSGCCLALVVLYLFVSLRVCGYRCFLC